MRLVLPLLLLASGAACAPPTPPAPPPPPEVQIPPPAAPKPEPPKTEPSMVSVAIVAAPKNASIDGDVGEWGSLLPPPPPPKKNEKAGKADADKDGGAAEAPPDPNPRDAASHVAVAIGAQGVLIAAEAREAARDGIWLGLGSEPPDLPRIGEYQRGGGVREFNCEVDMSTGQEATPDVKAACQAVLDRHAAFTAAHEARFQRLFRLDREGVRELRGDGSLAAIADAKAVWKAGEGGATVEASLPLSAMPRVNEAPLSSMRLWARAATGPKPPEAKPEQWVWLGLPDSLSFEPLGEIRTRVFQAIGSRVIYPPSLSYQPADPLHLETSSYPGYDRSGVVLNDEVLYEKQTTRGDLEIGYVRAYARWLAILKAGKLVDLVALDGAPRGVVERDGEIHVIAYSQGTAEDTGMDFASWTAIAVAPDGTYREDVVVKDQLTYGWKEVADFADKKLESFGVRGAVPDPNDWSRSVGRQITWRWDKKQKLYVGSVRDVPLPPKPKAAPAVKARGRGKKR